MIEYIVYIVLGIGFIIGLSILIDYYETKDKLKELRKALFIFDKQTDFLEKSKPDGYMNSSNLSFVQNFGTIQSGTPLISYELAKSYEKLIEETRQGSYLVKVSQPEAKKS